MLCVVRGPSLLMSQHLLAEVLQHHAAEASYGLKSCFESDSSRKRVQEGLHG
jgi:hypothetical protein